MQNVQCNGNGVFVVLMQSGSESDAGGDEL